ncbi:MAG: DNA topoisomerase (ATP-hydrolyzing) subunit A [Ilumatobacter sp.]|uniref:DNA gyrase subunit A n=1 Tax=Ilumatobacter sp. TaxID=1967498 RepID=UPI003C752DBE
MARKSKKKAPELFEFTETVVGLSAGDQLDRDYFAYARAVVEDRAIPAAADGLKPVHRRILWDMWTQRLLPDRPFVKTARVVGDTMALFHPHGDASIADALARLAQPFSNLVPLLDFHGNVGSPDFSPAAPRYTETRLGQFGMMLLDEVDQGVVQMVENYEGSTVEPKVLPATYPNLLVNGANGIAVGLSSYLPPHDPREVCEAALMLLDRKSASVDELMTVLPGPSFPSECTVTNGDELTDIYRSGQGRVVVRGAWLVEPVGRGRQQIIVTSLPYADTTLGSVEKFIAQVGDALDNGDLAGITAFNDESSNGLTRISVELAAGVDAEMVVPGLLRFTNLQVTNKVQMHFLDENDTVRLYNLRSALQAWVAHRIRVVVSRSEYRLEKIAERLHRLRGFLAVLVDIDETIAIVRTSKTRAVARERLIERFSIDESQANAVLDLNLGQLTEDAVIEFQTEATALEAEQKKLELLLSSETRQRSLVARELKETMDAFVDLPPRVTTITTESAPKVSKAQMVLDTPTTLYLDAAGWMQAIGQGSKAKPKIVPLQTFDTTTATTLVAVTDSGHLFRTLVASVGEKPTAAPSVLSGLAGEPIRWWLEPDLPTELLLVMSDGQVKRIATADCDGGDRKGGISIVKLAGDARVVAVEAFDETAPIVVATSDGQGIRFAPDDLRPMGRGAAGVRGIKTDAVVVFGGIPTEDDWLLVTTTKGMGKRIDPADLPEQGRGGKGVRVLPTGKWGLLHTGALTSAADVLVIDATDNTEPVAVSVGAFPQTARDAKPGKIRGHSTVIDRIVG